MAHGNLLNRKAEQASGQVNTEAGLPFFLEAAQMGHPYAQEAMAIFTERRNLRESTRWRRLAAESGLARAADFMGRRAGRYGGAVTIDDIAVDQAVYWLIDCHPAVLRRRYTELVLPDDTDDFLRAAIAADLEPLRQRSKEATAEAAGFRKTFVSLCAGPESYAFQNKTAKERSEIIARLSATITKTREAIRRFPELALDAWPADFDLFAR